MTDLAERLSRYLLARLRRAAVHDIYEHAAVAGVLESAFIDRREQTGLVWGLDPGHRFIPSGDMEADRTQIERLLRRAPADVEVEHDADDTEEASSPRAIQQNKRPAARAARTAVSASAAGRPRKGRGIDRDAMLRLLRTLAPPPSPADTAVVLSLAQAVSRSVDSLEQLLGLFRRRDPMIIVSVPLMGFEGRLGKLLALGRIMPRIPPQVDGLGNFALSGNYKPVADKQTRLVTFAGKDVAKSADDVIQRALAKALSGRDAPVLLAHHGPAKLSPTVLAAADLVIKLDKIDQPLLADILGTALGVPASSALTRLKRLGLDPAGIGLDELVLAIRPNRTIDEVIATLKVLAGERRRAEDADAAEGESGEQQKGKNKAGKGRTASKEGPRFDVTLPVPAEPAVTTDAVSSPSRPVPRVETLTGYGDAAAWAIDLKADLALWRQDKLAWADTSSRLLLHGPPGTGKTTFAHALCNTIGIPMIATSVGRWLEPGYLGDVLQQMSAAFETARTNAPSILFIDEIDNIGRRGGAGQDSNYWNSLVNRMLELLDGAETLDGVVVVGATNIPEAIDKALLRSGRLERQIELPLPDTDALTGILRFHLGSSADDVIGSRPAPVSAKAAPSPVPTSQSPMVAPAKRKTARSTKSRPQGGPN